MKLGHAINATAIIGFCKIGHDLHNTVVKFNKSIKSIKYKINYIMDV